MQSVICEYTPWYLGHGVGASLGPHETNSSARSRVAFDASTCLPCLSIDSSHCADRRAPNRRRRDMLNFHTRREV